MAVGRGARARSVVSKLSFERSGDSVVPLGPFDGKWKAKCEGSDPHSGFIAGQAGVFHYITLDKQDSAAKRFDSHWPVRSFHS